MLLNYTVGMASHKRGRDEVTCPPKDIDSKTIRGGEAKNSAGRPVSEFGTEEQRRSAATHTVSPDAIRFTPPQVARKDRLRSNTNSN